MKEEKKKKEKKETESRRQERQEREINRREIRPWAEAALGAPGWTLCSAASSPNYVSR